MLLSMLFVAGWGLALADVATADRRFVRHGPRWCWFVFTLTLPIAGAAAWLAFGRPPAAIGRPTPADRLDSGGARGPEDTEAWATFVADAGQRRT